MPGMTHVFIVSETLLSRATLPATRQPESYAPAHGDGTSMLALPTVDRDGALGWDRNRTLHLTCPVHGVPDLEYDMHECGVANRGPVRVDHVKQFGVARIDEARWRPL